MAAAARTDNRGQWTIKHAGLDAEFQTLVRKAAERQGMTVGAFVVETLRTSAQAVLKGSDGASTPPRTPARLEDVADALTERFAALLAQQEQRLEERLTRLETLPQAQPSPPPPKAAGVDIGRIRRWRR